MKSLYLYAQMSCGIFFDKKGTLCEKIEKGQSCKHNLIGLFLYAFILTATPVFHPFFLFINALFIRIACLQKFRGSMVLGHTQDRESPLERLFSFSISFMQ